MTTAVYAVYVDGRSHFVRWPDGRIEYRHDGPNGWRHRPAHPCEYEALTGWHPVATNPDGSVPTPARKVDVALTSVGGAS